MLAAFALSRSRRYLLRMHALLSLCTLITTLSACSDGPSPHDVGECGADWQSRSQVTQCEAACRSVPYNYGEQDETCRGEHPDSDSVHFCQSWFTSSTGERGCCVVNGDLMRFFSCG